uniref:Cytochrome P450, family 2, subfamily X, polypeptide 9 n=2 Tax=Astatotilapia calliptera TaxID=8154 RepID=A0AAX7UTD4_ASTCA
MKEAMVTKAADFAGRPQGLFINELSDGKGVIMADYGSKWREQRRFALMTLRNFGLGKNSMEERIHDEIKHIISTLEKNVERCQHEIDRVLDGKDRASFEDRHNMPYVQAVIHEVQRVANTVPLSVFHCTTRDTELMGYSIPRGTVIIQNLTSVLNEDGQWKFPHEFNRENFLNDQGEFVKPEAFMPFSAGPRICLGKGLARMELFLIMVTLLMRYQFIWPEDAGEPDFTPVYGITLTPKPFSMKIQLRTPQ